MKYFFVETASSGGRGLKSKPASPGQTGQSRGMTLVELMVGMTVGLVVLAGASQMYVNNLVLAQQLLLRTRVQQELRTTMDLMVREIRRSGYWGNSLADTSAAGEQLTNPYARISYSPKQIGYTYQRVFSSDPSAAPNPKSETSGFRLSTEPRSLQMWVGTGWQTISNTDVVSIPDDGFSIVPKEETLSTQPACTTTCDEIDADAKCPALRVRGYELTITGLARNNAKISYTLKSHVYVRNDLIQGVCPL